MITVSFKPRGFLKLNYFFYKDGLESGTINYKGFWKNNIVFSYEEKSWELKRKGLKSSIIINSVLDLKINSEFKYDWKGKGCIDLGGKLFYLDFDSIWTKKYYWKNEQNNKIISLLPSKIFHSETKMEWDCKNKPTDDYYILSFILFNMIISNRRIIATIS